ncbi:MAG: TraB/GumN family protein [Lysobacterales bacterium]
MRELLVLPLLLAALAAPIHALAEAPPTPDSASATLPAEQEIPASGQMMDAIVVSGELPGPGLWRISKGEHFMWVLGTQYPLPKRMKWVSREVEQAVIESQEVLLPTKASLTAKIGWFKGMLLLPAAMGSRKNPDKEKLVDVVPPELYARWLPLKAKYIGRSRSIEKQRPLFASQKLYEKAIKRAGLSNDSIVYPLVKKTAKKHEIPMISPEIKIDIGDPKQAIKDFAKTSLDDLDCFAKTLDRLETDLDTMRDRANAWATGDIEALRGLPFSDQNQACADAILKSQVTRERGLDDLFERLKDAWLDAAETAMAKNQITFAILPMSMILRPDGYVEALRARGYEVEEP